MMGFDFLSSLSNFTNDRDEIRIRCDSDSEAGARGEGAAVQLTPGSKCSLLGYLELEDHKHSTVQTRVVCSNPRKRWKTIQEQELLRLIDSSECNNVPGAQLQNLTVLSWNIRCPERERSEFYTQILEVIVKVLPDFCCFQYVQHEFKARLQEDKTIARHYYISNSNLNYIDFTSHAHHGLITLSRWPCEFIEYPFIDTHVGRYLLACQTVLNGMPLLVAHSHLDNLKKLRNEKLKKAGEILSSHKNVIWCGEFGEKASETEYVTSPYQDLQRDSVKQMGGDVEDKILLRSDRIRADSFYNLEGCAAELEGSYKLGSGDGVAHKPGVIGIVKFAGVADHSAASVPRDQH